MYEEDKVISEKQNHVSDTKGDPMEALLIS